MYASPLTALVDGSQFFDGLVCVISDEWKHLDTIRAYLDTAQIHHCGSSGCATVSSSNKRVNQASMREQGEHGRPSVTRTAKQYVQTTDSAVRVAAEGNRTVLEIIVRGNRKHLPSMSSISSVEIVFEEQVIHSGFTGDEAGHGLLIFDFESILLRVKLVSHANHLYTVCSKGKHIHRDYGWRKIDVATKSLFNVEGWVSVATCGGTGIGLLIAQAFADNGARVYISRRAEALQQAAQTWGASLAHP
ncbi:hypothetical protein AcW1_005056 [Taiwanofungus camphoratus]|nr:hypothetical protein AcW2_005935 [Antrodia cinnamomea]KAI0960577.1 hypothetical protein AcW1_005056 [Antrodia cinnamomea]